MRRPPRSNLWRMPGSAQTKGRSVTATLDAEDYDRFAQMAKDDQRSVSNFAKLLLLQAMADRARRKRPHRKLTADEAADRYVGT